MSDELSPSAQQTAEQKHDTARIRLWTLLPMLLAVPVALAYLVYLLVPSTGTYHDDGVYLVTAKSLAEGNGYKIQSLPSELPQTKYPVLFPALLAVLWKLCPGGVSHAWVFKLLPVAGVWIVAALMILVGRRNGLSEPAACWAALAWVAAPAVLFHGSLVMPESLFTACCVGAVILLEIANRKEGRDSLIAAGMAGALMASSILLRSLGATLAPLALYLVWRRKWRAAAVLLLTSAVLVLPWLVHSMKQPVSMDPVESYYTKLNYKEGNLFVLKSLEQVQVVFLSNVIMQLVGPQRLFGLGSNTFGAALGVLISLTALAGLAAALKRGPNLMAVWTILYLGAVTLWMWPPERYLVPALPFLLIFAAQVLERALRGGGVKSRLCAGLLCICALLVISTDSRMVLETHRNQWAWPREGLAEDWMPTQAALAWLSQNTPREAVIGANLDPMVYLYTGRKSIRLFNYNQFELFYGTDPKRRPLGNSEDLRTHLKKHHVTYMLLTPMKNFREFPFVHTNVEELVRRYPAAILPVAGFQHPGYELFEVKQDLLGRTP